MITLFKSFLLVLAIGCNLYAANSPASCPIQVADGSRSQARSTEIVGLISLIRDGELQKTNPECITSAIYRLGTLKATEAMPDLAKLLGYRRKLPNDNSPFMIHPVMEESHYPATEALVNIGKPALPVLQDVIATQGASSVVGHNAVDCVLQILRDSPPDAVKFFDKAALTARSPESRANLMSARAEALKWCSLGESVRGYSCQ